MFKKSLIYKLILAVIILTLAQMACSLTNPVPSPTPASSSGGVVKGVVYADSNGNAVIDPGEGPLAGAQVSLSGCGPVQNQVTGADGAFNFSGLPAGSCQASVSKAGWHFSGSFPSLGYPIPVASDPALPTAFSMYMTPDSAATTPELTATDTLTPTASPTSTLTPTITATATLSAPMITANTVNANCRFGPGTEFLSVGALMVDQTVPILGTISDHSWWQITNPWATNTQCWVASSVTSTSGDLSRVPVLATPTGLVTGVSVSSTNAVVHGTCGGPNPTNFQVSITTNGPATVVYHLEIYNNDGSLRNKTDDASRTFASADTQTFDPAGAYRTDCGTYLIKVLVTKPNSKTAQANWSVVSP